MKLVTLKDRENNTMLVNLENLICVKLFTDDDGEFARLFLRERFTGDISLKSFKFLQDFISNSVIQKLEVQID